VRHATITVSYKFGTVSYASCSHCGAQGYFRPTNLEPFKLQVHFVDVKIATFVSSMSFWLRGQTELTLVVVYLRTVPSVHTSR
jgi:hypothetical protein